MKTGIFLLCVFLLSCFSPTFEAQPLNGYMFVANRGAETLSVINTKSDEIVRTINMTASLPTPTLLSEPMYPIVCGKYVFVGDRRNQLVHAYDLENDLAFAGAVPTGPGIFHMYGNTDCTEFWVLNDGNAGPDRSITVFDPRGPPFNVTTTIYFADDLTASLATMPHDIIFHPELPYAYVTIFGYPGFADLILQYNVTSKEVINRAQVGKSPHVGLIDSPTLPGTRWNLFAPAQGSLIDSLAILDPITLERIDTIIGMAGAHGIYGPSADGCTWYVTNLPGLGLDALFAFDACTSKLLVEATVDAPYNTPHNIAMTNDGKKLYLTHSGANVQVTVWSIGEPGDPRPKMLRILETGLNAYGIYFLETPLDFGGNESSGNVLSSWLQLF